MKILMMLHFFCSERGIFSVNTNNINLHYTHYEDDDQAWHINFEKRKKLTKKDK